jgi:hypothetical protein
MIAPLAVMVVCQAGPSLPIHTPYARAEKLAFRHIALTPSVPQYGLEELHVDLGATYDNPFDSSDVSLDATLTCPSGRVLHVPGFLYRSYKRELKAPYEIDTPDSEPEWRVRLAPTETGTQLVTLTLKDRTGMIRSDVLTFQSTASEDPGFVRVSKHDHRYFAFDSGKAYFPVGANMCWGNNPGTFSYDSWLPDFGKVGCNYGRLWLSPGFSTFALEQVGKPEDGLGTGQFDLGAAWRLDYVLQSARANGLYLMLCIDSYNVLRDKDNSPYWEKSPQNSDNGGPLRVLSDFWTNDRMDAFYKSKLRYLVARYGWDTHVMSWEFWNEVNGVRDYDVPTVRAWHTRMAAALKALDPYHHLRTTSFSDPIGERSIDEIADLDYTQTHAYGGPDVTGTTMYEQTRKSEYGKPHYVGEVGMDADGPRADLDLKGQQVHDPLWAAIASGGSGGAMCWWWYSLIAPNKLYPLYRSASDFLKDVDFPNEDFRQTDVHVRYDGVPKNPPRKDLVLENGPVSWSPSVPNQPHTITINGKGASGQLPLSGIFHGVRNHPDLHNPIEIRFELQRPAKFVVEVGDVSGYGGAKLVVKLDGEPILTRDFSAPTPDSGDTIKKYAGDYEITVPDGIHSVTVENTGADWFMVGYRVREFFTRTVPPLQAYAISGERTALCWIRNEDDTLRNVVELKHVLQPTPPCILGMSGLASGTWKTVVWDTWTGRPIITNTVHVGIDGNVRVSLPTINQDVALKLTKVEIVH